MEQIIENFTYLNTVLHYPFMIETIIVSAALGIYVSDKYYESLFKNVK